MKLFGLVFFGLQTGFFVFQKYDLIIVAASFLGIILGMTVLTREGLLSVDTHGDRKLGKYKVLKFHRKRPL